MAAGLERDGWAIAPGFLSPDEVAALAAEGRRLRDDGGFRPAGVGRGRGVDLRPEIRTDHVSWLDPESAAPALRRYLDAVEALRLELNRRLYLGLVDFEAHLAVYPPGAFYRTHLDRFRAVPRRAVSCLLYLNEAWRREDGGQLRLYLEPGVEPHEGSPAIDVLPEAGTLAVFLAGDFYHEVLPAGRERWSVTGWLRTRA